MSSPSTQTLHPAEEHYAEVDSELSQTLESLQVIHRSAYEEKLGLLLRVQQILLEEEQLRVSFIERGGYLNLVSILASLEESTYEGSDSLQLRDDLRYEIVKLVFIILSLSFEGNETNRAVFLETIGYHAVGEALKLSGLMEPQVESSMDLGRRESDVSGADSEITNDSFKEADGGNSINSLFSPSPAEKLFSILYAFLVEDFTAIPIYSQMKSQQLSFPNQTEPLEASTPQPEPFTPYHDYFTTRLAESPLETIENPQIIPLFFALYEQLPTEEESLKLMVLVSIEQLAKNSRRCQVLLSENGLTEIGLRKMFDEANSLDSRERTVWISLVERLLEMGAGGEELRMMFQKVLKGWRQYEKEELDEKVLGLILTAVQKSRLPNFIHFDLSLQGHSSISLPSLGKAFPPNESGYTLLAWTSIESPPTTKDDKLILFGCNDNSKRCFVEVSISPSLRLSLSTSTTRPAVVFRNFTFELNKFYHIALVHQRPKFSSTSTVSLYIDGILVEATKTYYPASPPKDWPVQAWLGTPRANQPNGMLGKGKSQMKWNLGPTWLLAKEIPGDMVYVCATLGPRYTSNFQDQLGQFQTNSTSTLLNVKVDRTEKKELVNSALVLAIRDRGAIIIPEDKVYFALSASNVITTGIANKFTSSQLSTQAQVDLKGTLDSKGSVIVNSALARLEDALVEPYGLAALDGGAFTVTTLGLDEGISKIGGIAIALRLVELSKTSDQLTKSTSLFIALIQDSWRNSEDAERIQAYEILALQLKGLVKLMTPATHDLIFALVGYDFKNSFATIVSNPLACRFLLLDFSLWSLMDLGIQVDHFDRIRDFLIQSDHRDFNLKRLAKMHLTRKLLFCLRINTYEHSLLDEVVDTLMVVATTNFTTETVRHLATFLTATLCQGSPPDFPSIDSPSILEIHSSDFVSDASKIDNGSPRASLCVLQRLHDLLFEAEESQKLVQFAKIITIKWVLLFLLDSTVHPFAAVLALRILVRLLQTQGSTYITKFINSNDGFSVLRTALPRLWKYSQIHLALFSLLHNHDITTLPLDAPFSTITFQKKLLLDDTTPFRWDVYRIIIACLGKALEDVSNLVLNQIEVPTLQVEDLTLSGSSSTDNNFPFQSGLEILSELLGSADSNDCSLIASPSSLADFIHIMQPFLSPIVSPIVQGQSPLPALSSRNDYRLVDMVSELVAAANGISNSEPTAGTSLDPIRSQNQSIELGLVAMLKFLGERIVIAISLTDSGAPLQLLVDVFVAGNTKNDLKQMVTFRTHIINFIAEHLIGGSIEPVISSRIISFIEFATLQAFQGWCCDLQPLLNLVLSYVERILEGDGAFGPSTLDSIPLGSLFQSLNRLVLLAFESSTPNLLETLIRHQLSLFASQNTDIDFFRCLVQRLDFQIRKFNSDEYNPAIELLKLLILERHVDAEVALGIGNLDESGTRLVDRLINSDNSNFVALLVENRIQLQELDLAWTNFVDTEATKALELVTIEVESITTQAAEFQRLLDGFGRRTKRQQNAIYEWSEGIHDVEITRVAHTKQDISDHATFVGTEWTEQISRLERESGIWGDSNKKREWRLDFTEGHSRMRKKLQPSGSKKEIRIAQVQDDVLSSGLKISRQDSMSVWPKEATPTTDHEVLLSPMSPKETGIWSDTFQPTLLEPPTPPLKEETEISDAPIEEDKNRKVRRCLEPGDVILSVFNISRIVGLHASSGLLLLAKKNIYLVDGFFQKLSGELVDAWDAPDEERDLHLQTLADLAGRTAKTNDDKFDAAHRSRRWTYSELIEVHERKYLFRSVALEIFFSDGRSFLITFGANQRQYAYDLLAIKSPNAIEFGSLNVASAGFSSKVTDVVRGQRTKLNRMTKRWEKREVSNFDYLMFLNTCAGRTYNDLTNYPIFPWILADYDSEVLDLTDPKSFRDFTKPMGAQTQPRRDEFKDRYSQLMELDDGTKPFHYGTHYSSAMIVVSYLVRMNPFTSSYLDLQGGSFDHADRMFWSIGKAWDSCSKESRADVRELIPEFFYLPDFLSNPNGLDFGKRQETDSTIDEVELPRWAKGNPRVFIDLHRQALESEYVSLHLSSWIDLIFGYQSTSPAAIEALNVFHHLSYEGAIDLDSITDEQERKAATSTIHNFGMTPRQLFAKPHPARPIPLISKTTNLLFSPDSLIEVSARALIQTILPVKEINREIRMITPNLTGALEKVQASGRGELVFLNGTLIIKWGWLDSSVRVFVNGSDGVTGKEVWLGEGMHDSLVSCATFSDEDTLITGSLDTNVIIWKWKWKTLGKEGYFIRLDYLRGHHDHITCLTASRAFSIVVSGSKDNSAIIWDLNRHRYVQTLRGHEAPVQLVALSETTGDIATCSSSTLRIWTVNGILLATQATSNFLEPITAVAFSQSEISPIIATGHRNSTIQIYTRIPSASPTGFSLSLITTLSHKIRINAPFPPAAITSLKFGSRCLWTGDEKGRIWLWSGPGSSEMIFESGKFESCATCETRFGVLESRRRCVGCCGIFCSLCTTTSIELGGRFCSVCFSKLSPLLVL